MQTNDPYYGDNLDILRRCVPDESVDLIYLDPRLALQTYQKAEKVKAKTDVEQRELFG